MRGSKWWGKALCYVDTTIVLCCLTAMGITTIIQTDRQLAEAERAHAEMSSALNSVMNFAAALDGIPAELIPDIRRAFEVEAREKASAIKSYQAAKDGDCSQLMELAGADLGRRLIAARVCKGFSQKELARKLGLKEQAIQRWEADHYRSITIANFQSVSRALGLRLFFDTSSPEPHDWAPTFETPRSDASKVLRHAKKRGWIEGDDPDRLLAKRISEHVQKHGTPSLLRTGLNSHAENSDWSLIAWKAQVTWVAEQRIKSLKQTFQPLDFSWLSDLVRLSTAADGPKRAKEFLADKGIVLVVEPQIQGMKVDGAAFLVDGVPVIGLTLLRDSIDNFWFTLLHELGHVFLHYRSGLNSGFFDDAEARNVDELEEQADRFARNLIVSDEAWRKSPARIAKSPAIVESVARKLGISPAILFGRIRMERGRYDLFSNKIGRGTVRRQFPEYEGC
ncbi:MAG TPA: DNA-binding protein [Erythrobacter sp.]|nr:DNA-binding protein [Erythrobacter sp.]